MAETCHRIDVHHHFLPQPYMKAEQERIADYTHGGMSANRLVSWTSDQAIEVLDENGIEFALGSISTPGPWFGDVAASRKLVRGWNEEAAKAVQAYPDRLGFFAPIAPPDTEGALKEIEYALDTLKADGIGLLTNYDGKSLGDESFKPVFEELNRRKCVVYIHPTAHVCTAGLIPGLIPQGIEFPLDTTRTIMSMLLNGTLAATRDVTFIFSHGGGVLPFLAGRMEHTAERRENVQKWHPEGVEAALQRLYCDTASAQSIPQLAAMFAFYDESHILFGSDYPFISPQAIIDGLDAYPMTKATRTAIDRENALALLPLPGLKR